MQVGIHETKTRQLPKGCVTSTIFLQATSLHDPIAEIFCDWVIHHDCKPRFMGDERATGTNIRALSANLKVAPYATGPTKDLLQIQNVQWLFATTSFPLAADICTCVTHFLQRDRQHAPFLSSQNPTGHFAVMFKLCQAKQSCSPTFLWNPQETVVYDPKSIDDNRKHETAFAREIPQHMKMHIFGGLCGPSPALGVYVVNGSQLLIGCLSVGGSFFHKRTFYLPQKRQDVNLDSTRTKEDKFLVRKTFRHLEQHVSTNNSNNNGHCLCFDCCELSVKESQLRAVTR